MPWKLGYELPKEVYMQTLWFIRTYPQLKDEYTDLLFKTHLMDGQPRGTDVGDPTGEVAVRAAELSKKIGAIEDALCEIPVEYRDEVFSSVLWKTPFSDNASKNTWATYRRRFVFFVAKNAGFC